MTEWKGGRGTDRDGESRMSLPVTCVGDWYGCWFWLVTGMISRKADLILEPSGFSDGTSVISTMNVPDSSSQFQPHVGHGPVYSYHSS